MAITPANYAAFITTVNTRVGQIYSEMNSAETSRMWSTDEAMTGSIWETGWTGRMPKPRAWFGSRVVHEPAPQTYSVSPMPYELTYGIDRFKLDDSDPNSESIFWRMLPDMAFQWRRQREYELRDLLEAAGVWGATASQLSLDGLSHFNTAHPIDLYLPTFNFGGLFTAGTYCNDFSNGGQTIGGVGIGGALSPVALTSLFSYMRTIPDETGENLGIAPDAIMVPNTLSVEADIILKASFWAPPTWGAFAPLTGNVGAADNMLAKQGISKIVNPFLKNTKRWYMMDLSHNMKPMLWITREASRVVPRIAENDPIVFDSHRYTWGGWDRVAPAWNFPWLMARSAPSGF